MNTKFLGKGVDKPHQVCYNKEKRKEVDTMTITRIKVMTMNEIYEEMCYGLAEMTEKVGMIEKCDNVLGVEVMSMETGEILYTHHSYPTDEIYVAETLVLDLVKEVLG